MVLGNRGAQRRGGFLMNYAAQSLLPNAPLAPANPWDVVRPATGIFALDLATSRLGNLPVQVDTLWDVDRCPVRVLPWLAWAVSVEEWNANWSEEKKRAALRENMRVHQHKGTKAAVLHVLSAAGFPDANLREGIGQLRRNGTFKRNGDWCHHNPDGHWAYYHIVLPVGSPNVSANTLSLVERMAPERCVLLGVIYE